MLWPFRSRTAHTPRRSVRPSFSWGSRHARRFIPTLELLERRELLATGVFLQGTAFVDSNHDHTLDPNDLYLQGALISLYQGTTTSGTPLAVTATNSNGAYLFNDSNVPTSYGNPGLNPGIYTLVETPPLGYANDGTQTLSQLNPASSVGIQAPFR